MAEETWEKEQEIAGRKRNGDEGRTEEDEGGEGSGEG